MRDDVGQSGSEARPEGEDFHEIPVVSVELCSYFPSAHPMMSTVM